MRIPSGWTALTFLDPFAAVHLLAKPRLGVMLTMAIFAVITIDVALKGWVGKNEALN